MSLELWLAFVVASTVLLVIPGPTILLVIGHGLAHGPRATLPTVLGVTLGDVVAVALSLAGLGAVMATSAMLFTVVKWLGAGYLVYLGVQMWRAHPAVPEPALGVPVASERRLAWRAFVVTALNPKSIVFFVAFLPQFVDPHASITLQLWVLGTTFVGLAMVIVATYAVLAGSARRLFVRPQAMALVNKLGGSLLIGAGLLTVGLRRAS